MAESYNLVDMTITGDSLKQAFSKVNTNFILLKWKPNVANYSDLPSVGNGVGDVRLVESEALAYVWSGTQWLGLRSDVSAEVATARGSKSSLDARLDVVLEENGALKPAVVYDEQIVGPISASKIQQGTGSGLNADLLDGLNSVDFALAGHNHDTVYALIGHNHDAVYVNEGQLSSISTGMLVDDAVNRDKIHGNVAGSGLKQNLDGSLSPDVARIVFMGRVEAGIGTSIVISLVGLLTTDIVMLSFERGTDDVYIKNYVKGVEQITVNFSATTTVNDSFVNYIVYRAT